MTAATEHRVDLENASEADVLEKWRGRCTCGWRGPTHDVRGIPFKTPHKARREAKDAATADAIRHQGEKREP